MALTVCITKVVFNVLHYITITARSRERNNLIFLSFFLSKPCETSTPPLTGRGNTPVVSYGHAGNNRKADARLPVFKLAQNRSTSWRTLKPATSYHLPPNPRQETKHSADGKLRLNFLFENSVELRASH